MVAANSVTMARPSPAPRVATTESPRPRKKRVKTCSRSALGTPGPSSSTASSARSRCSLTRTRMTVPAGEYFAALPTRLDTTRSTACREPATPRPGTRLVQDLVVRGQVGLLVEDAGHDLAEVQHRVVGDDPGTALESREVQQVLDEGTESLGVAVDLLGVQAGLLGAQRVPAGGEDLCVAGDGADRCPQLVRRGRQEHRLQLVHRPHPVQQVALLGEGLGVRQRRGQDLGGGSERAQVVAVQVAAGDDPEPGHRAPAPAQDQAQGLSGRERGGQHRRRRGRRPARRPRRRTAVRPPRSAPPATAPGGPGRPRARW